MRIGELFSGYGGLGAGVQAVLGGSIAWHSEIDPGACKILAHRYPDVPNHGDITATDWSAVEPVDVLTGGFPCQDLSLAGLRKGLRPDTRSGLWTQFAYAIDQLRPGLVVIENVRGLLSAGADSSLEPCPWCVGDDGKPSLRALGAVLGDLAGLGYDASWQGLRASDVGAPHGRFRVFVIAWPAADARGEVGEFGTGLRADGASRLGWPRSGDRRGDAADPNGLGLEAGRRPRRPRTQQSGDFDSVSALSAAAPDARGDRLIRGSELHERPKAGVAASQRRHTDGRDVEAARLDWGQYADAIRRWERVTRPAPAPTEVGPKGAHRLSAPFVEFMMGLPAGWVTDVPGLSRKEQLKALGNGVVPQQAAEALRLLLPDVGVDVGPSRAVTGGPVLLPTPNVAASRVSNSPGEMARKSPALGAIACSLNEDGAA